MTERQGVEVDYCPRCRGVWLDRGELDKILDRASAELGEAEDRTPRYDRDRYPERDDDRDRDRGSYPPKKRKRSFLSDMFEFGGGDD